MYVVPLVRLMEILIILFALLLGCCAGVITGLIPGLHTNTIAVIALSISAILTKFFSLTGVGVFLVSMVVVHSFVDFIPATFLGAPEAETALSVLPGHKMLLEGKGYQALVLTVIGGIGAFLVGLAILPFFFVFLGKGYLFLTKIIPYILILFSVAFILIEKGLKQKIWALLVFLFSGVLGLIVLNNVNITQPLFPLLTGLFGISTLIISMSGTNKMPRQSLDVNEKFFTKNKFLDYLKAAFSSVVVSILPAIGAAQATVIAQGFVRFKNYKDYLVIIGGINTVSSIFVLTTFYLIGKARTGVMATLQQITVLDFYTYLILIAACLVAAGIGVFATLKIGKYIAARIWKIKYRKLSLVIITFLFVLAFLFSSWIGLLVVSVATAIGLLAPLVGCRRIHAMGVLVLPVVFYFI